ncbi:MAG TPA: hypothetical protein VE968_08675 [Sphingomicrobium sp.]|nr:hypothetical protein [Sphingomicrobium sp.]
MADRTWTAPVLEELSIPAGTFGSTDDPNNNRDFSNGTDLSSTAS